MLDNIHTSLFDITAFAVIVLLVSTCAYFLETCSPSMYKKILIITTVVILVCVGIKSMLPTTKQAMIIYGVPKILNNEVLQKEVLELYATSKDYLINKLKENDNGKK
jgi:hypothetical protein